jgi:threonine/homoserine/homoserine lactone efflux protein
MTQLLGLVGFSVVSSITPGPNNVLLWASGASFGVRRTVPHILGTAGGIGAMALAAGAGLAAIVAAAPGVALAMRLVGSGYLLYLAWQIGHLGPVGTVTIARPLDVRAAAAFQLVNPKAWVFALGSVTTFRPPDLPVALGSVLVAATMMLVIVPTAAVWAAGGGAMSSFVEGERRQRIVAIALGVVVAATVVLVWV